MSRAIEEELERKKKYGVRWKRKCGEEKQDYEK
jgi:hypothetical protein